jgi:FixJ family two-component response regulator
MHETVHIVDPEAHERARLATALAGEPLCVRTYASAKQFLEQVGETSSGCVLATADLPGPGVRALIDVIRDRGLSLAVIVVGDVSDFAAAVDMVRAGAIDFLERPVSDRRLRSAVREAVGTDP